MSITLQTVSSGYNLSAINDNFQSLQTALNDNILWRNGSVAGETLMTRDLDMNGYTILNLAADPDNPDSILTRSLADSLYYNIDGDVLEGDLDAGQYRLTNLAAPVAATDASRKMELDSEVLARQNADANIQEQLTGNVPLEASAFSEISWHGQQIANSVTIPADKNAWSFGPQMEILEGQAVTVSDGASWTIADGRVVEDEDLHNLIADTIKTSDGSVTVNVNDVATGASVTALAARMAAEENKVNTVAQGGTNATTASAARVNLGAAASGANTDITSITGSAASLTTSRTFITNLASTTAVGFNGTANNSHGVTGTLPITNGGTGGTTAAEARTALGAARSAGVTDGSSAAAGVVGEVITNTTTGTALTSGTPVNLTSIALTAGDWEVVGTTLLSNSAVNATLSFGGLSTTSATLPAFPNLTRLETQGGTSSAQFAVPSVRFNITTSTVVYLVGQLTFPSGTATGSGYIRARRVR